MADTAVERPLHEIMALKEPQRSEVIREWVEGFSVEEGDEVLLKPVGGAGIQVVIQGKKLSFPPAGRRVGRKRAISILRDYGPGGKYVGVDRKTGMTPSVLQTMSREDMKKWEGVEFDFNENYLVHVPPGTDESVAEETEKNG